MNTQELKLIQRSLVKHLDYMNTGRLDMFDDDLKHAMDAMSDSIENFSMFFAKTAEDIEREAMKKAVKEHANVLSITQ